MERSIQADEFKAIKDNAQMILDIRRNVDFESSTDTVAGAIWKDPAKIEDWIASMPKEGQVVIFCVRGGGVSNSVVDRLHSDGINAQFIEGGIEALKAVAGMVSTK